MSEDQDLQHLKLLSIFHYVYALLVAGFSSIFLLHVGLGLLMIFSPGSMGEKGSDAAVGGGVMTGVGAIVVMIGWGVALGIAFVGRSLGKHRRHLLCLIVAGLETVTCVPLGTILGVFTLVVLLRPSVKALFASRG
jgi:hypothetical protein